MKDLPRLTVLALILLAEARLLSAQSEAVRFEHLSIEDGLANVTVQAILQDTRGFLWIGTLGGLNRHDGQELLVLRPNPDDPDSLSSAVVTSLVEDPGGDLWIGTQGGLDRYDPRRRRFVHFRHDPDDPTSLPHDQVTVLHRSAGNLWVGTRGGLASLVPGDGRLVRYRHDPDDPTSLSHDAVTAIAEDASGHLWIGTEGGGLDRLDPRSGRFVHHRHDPDDPVSLADDRVRAVAVDGGGVWVGTEDGLDRLEPGVPGFTHYRHDPEDETSLSHDVVRTLSLGPSGHLWVGTTGGGLNRFHPGRRAFVRYRHDPDDPASLGEDFIRSLYEDRSGTLWVGTWGTGIDHLDPRRGLIVHYRHDPEDPASLTDSRVTSLLADRAGSVWAGTVAGLDHLDPATGRFVHYSADPQDPEGLAHPVVSILLEDRSGRLWIGTYGGGLHVLADPSGDDAPPSRARFVRYRHDPGRSTSLSDDVVTALCEDGSGVLWVGTRGGLDRFDPRRPEDGFHRRQHDPQDPESLVSGTIRVVLEDSSGRLWIGSTSGGVGRLDAAREELVRFRHDRQDPRSLLSDRIFDLHEDRSGRLWVAGQGGLQRFDPATGGFERVQQTEGLEVVTVLEDRLGRLWISTNVGLARYDPVTGRFAVHDVRDGVQGGQFSQAARARTPDGRLYFGGTRGLNALDPETFLDEATPPPIVLTSFSVFEREAELDHAAPYLEEVELRHDQSFFSIGYTALAYSRADKSRFTYRLEGFDPAWVEAGSRRRAYYTGVPPGDYVFRVRGTNADGVWNEKGRSLRVVVLPPPWRTWWAYAFYALAAVSGIGGYLRLHFRKLERERQVSRMKSELLDELRRRNVELSQINFSLAHDLKNPLVTIRNYAGLLERDVRSGDTARFEADLDHVRRAAEDVLCMLDELHELTRLGQEPSTALGTVELDALVQDAARPLRARFAEAGLELRVSDASARLFGDRRRLVEMIRTLLDNAFKFRGDTPAPRIEVTAKSGDGEVIVSVRDHGIGVPARYHERIFNLFESLDPSAGGTGVGLALARRIVELHGGRIWVESEGEGKGSTFRFALPHAAAQDVSGVLMNGGTHER